MQKQRANFIFLHWRTVKQWQIFENTSECQTRVKYSREACNSNIGDPVTYYFIPCYFCLFCLVCVIIVFLILRVNNWLHIYSTYMGSVTDTLFQSALNISFSSSLTCPFECTSVLVIRAIISCNIRCVIMC